MTLRSSVAAAALASAVLFVLYGLLLQRLPDLEAPSPGANPAFADGLRVLFVVVGVLLAALYAWRYVSVARAAAVGVLDLRHRRRLRRARFTAIWTAFVLVLFCAALVAGRSPALPLALTCLVVALLWAAAAVVTVRAERAQPDPARLRAGAGR